MAKHFDPLHIYRLISDVVDAYTPRIVVDVYYPNKHVTNGCMVKPSVANDPPLVTMSGKPRELYTLVMVDPDAPTPTNPDMREWVHWLVINIPGGGNAFQGTEVVPYMCPKPPTGIHRYIIVFFEQKRTIPPMEPPPSRGCFNTRVFARDMNFGLPVASVYFIGQKDD